MKYKELGLMGGSEKREKRGRAKIDDLLQSSFEASSEQGLVG